MGGGERGDTPAPLPGEEGHLVEVPQAIVWTLASPRKWGWGWGAIGGL